MFITKRQFIFKYLHLLLYLYPLIINNLKKQKTMTAGENILQDVPKEQRFKSLTEMATKSASEKVRRHYTDEEKNQMKEFVADESVTLLTQEEEFAEIQKKFREAIKACKTPIKDAVKNLRRGYSEAEETVFLIDDQEAGKMHVWDQFGVYLYSRNLYAEERQLTTLSKVS